MNEKIKAAYLSVSDLWSEFATMPGIPTALLEPLGKAAAALRDAALISDQPGLRQCHCVSQQGIVHAANQRDGKPRCGLELNIAQASDVAVRVPTCQRCVEILIDEAQAKI